MATRTATHPPANAPCWCGSGRKFKHCHKASTQAVHRGRVSPPRPVPDAIAKPPYADGGAVPRWDEPVVKDADTTARMRRAGREAADVLIAVGKAVAPGITTDELDQLCHDEALARDAYPSPLNYGGPEHPFPKSVCTSVNEVICHGIPDDRALRDGDIVNLDVTLYIDGVHGDTNATFLVGHVDPDSAHLVDVTRECLARAIAAVMPGERMNAIGRAIQQHADANGCSVIRDFVGHGVGEQFHTGFMVPHYYVSNDPRVIEAGMVFTIEPMIALGDWGARMCDDHWTVVTADGRRTAQFEHTLVVTDAGAEILTTPTTTDGHPYWSV